VVFAEQDEAKTWRRAAHASADADPLFPRSASNSWSADSPTGRGPGGIAVRTGQPKVVRDILNDPAAVYWREAATQRGYRSVVALPLKSEDLTYAVLVICSTEADVFDAEEVAILNELASNLAFGVMALRERQAKSAFLAQMSHELRTPLNAIVGFTHILQRDPALTERHTRALKIIQDSGQHLLTLINDILDLARIDAAKLELYPHDFDLRVMLQLVGDIIRVKADDKHVRFVYHGDSDLPKTVRADEKRLRQVLLNLLSNAVKFTDAGRVTLRAMRLAPPDGNAVARLRFEIEDEGIGMSETQMGRLFQPFEQLAEAKRREGGTGLGLAISRQLLRLMGADIEVRSRPGEGSVFAFEIQLPISEAPARDLPVDSAPLGYLGERRKILVVGEALQSRTRLVEELAALGFEVAAVANGREALEVVARFRPHLLVVELTMPIMDGFEATRRLRQMPEYAELPIIATAATATPDAQERSRAAGANVFVDKPLQEGLLVNHIGALLHLEWIREQAAAAPRKAANDDGAVVPPPAEEMLVLRELARAGDMRSILGRAEYVRILHPRYAAFAARLRALAECHDSSAIANMIERYSTHVGPT
jgi:signal transduction histidine kinase/CheY-like chemotaxis protein